MHAAAEAPKTGAQGHARVEHVGLIVGSIVVGRFVHAEPVVVVVTHVECGEQCAGEHGDHVRDADHGHDGRFELAAELCGHVGVVPVAGAVVDVVDLTIGADANSAWKPRVQSHVAPTATPWVVLAAALADGPIPHGE